MGKGNLRYYWSIFLRRFPYFFGVVLIVTVSAVLIAISLPPTYQAATRLIVEAPQIPDDLAASTVQTPAEEQLQIIQERLMTRANLLDIAQEYNVFENIASMSADDIESGMRQATDIRTSVGREAAALMSITFDSRSPETAAAVLNHYLTMIQNEDVASRTQRASQTLEFFEQEVSRLSEELATRSASILQFQTENADALPESLEYRMSQRTILQERLSQADRDIAGLEDQRQRLIQIFESTGQVSGVAGPALSPEQQQLNELRSQLNEALVIYSADNPRVRLLEARIARLEEVVAAQPTLEGVTTATSTGNPLLDVQLAELETRREVLEEQKEESLAQLDELNDSIARTPKNAIRLDELELDYENIQLQYNTAVDRLSRASTGERIEVMARGQRVAIVDPPAIPTEPSSPNRMLIAGGGGFLGIFIGAILIVILEILNRSIRRPEDLVRRLGVTPLSTIPYMATTGELRRQRLVRIVQVLVIFVGIPVGLYSLHTYYMPLDQLFAQAMSTVGLN